MTTRIRILIAEDNDFVRQQVRRCLEHSGRFDVLAEACDGTEAVRLIAQCQPAVIRSTLVGRMSKPFIHQIECARCPARDRAQKGTEKIEVCLPEHNHESV